MLCSAIKAGGRGRKGGLLELQCLSSQMLLRVRKPCFPGNGHLPRGSNELIPSFCSYLMHSLCFKLSLSQPRHFLTSTLLFLSCHWRGVSKWLWGIELKLQKWNSEPAHSSGHQVSSRWCEKIRVMSGMQVSDLELGSGSVRLITDSQAGP